MTSPAKPTKTTKNQPQPFRESLAMPMPSRATLAAPSHSQMRLALWAVWALATIAAGVGAGTLIRDHVTTADPAEAPVPVARAAVHQPAAANQTTIMPLVTATQPDLAVKPGASTISQAQAGSPFAQQATAYYQPASDPDSLQPGFQTEVRIQGQIGTQPIR